MLPQYNNKQNKVLLCSTDTSLYIYICVKHFGTANIKNRIHRCQKIHATFSGVMPFTRDAKISSGVLVGKGKGKSVPLQAWSGPEGSRKFGIPDCVTAARDVGKVSLTHRPPLPPGNAPGTHFC